MSVCADLYMHVHGAVRCWSGCECVAVWCCIVCCCVLQRVAVCCNVLQCVPVCYSVSQCVAMYCSAQLRKEGCKCVFMSC